MCERRCFKAEAISAFWVDDESFYSVRLSDLAQEDEECFIVRKPSGQ